jgi:hypothetical protein
MACWFIGTPPGNHVNSEELHVFVGSSMFTTYLSTWYSTSATLIHVIETAKTNRNWALPYIAVE